MPDSPTEILPDVSAANPTFASYTTALTGTNNDIYWKAVAPGTSGNSLTIAYTISGSTTPAFSVVGSAVSFVGGTTTTAQQLVDAWRNASDDVKAKMVPAVAPGNDGTGALITLSAQTLTGGTGSLPSAPQVILS